MRVAISGLGRIGRATLKVLFDHSDNDLELVAANDLVSAENLAYLLRYDTAYGPYDQEVEVRNDSLVINGKQVVLCNEKQPSNLPWGDLAVDTVFECSGVFRTEEEMRKHLDAGAKHVILSAPAKSEGVPMVVLGANTVDEFPELVSCASCTTNCITPVMEVLDRRVGMQKATMTTVHAYTSSQGVVDGPAKKMRRGRAAAANFVPTTTGAAKATGKSHIVIRSKR